MPVEFLTDEEAASYGRYNGAPPRAELERAFFLDDTDKAIFNDAVVWLLERGVHLPEVTTLARLVAQVRDEATQRLWDTLSQRLTPKQREMLERLLDVPDGARVSDLERWRKGRPSPRAGTWRALTRVSEITAVGLAALEFDSVVPHRRLVDLARYGMAAKAPQLRRHPPSPAPRAIRSSTRTSPGCRPWYGTT